MGFFWNSSLTIWERQRSWSSVLRLLLNPAWLGFSRLFDSKKCRSLVQTILSISFPTTEVRLIGRSDPTSLRSSPFFGIGLMSAVLHICGTWLVFHTFLNRSSRYAKAEGPRFLSILGWILSGPAAFLPSTLERADLSSLRLSSLSCSVSHVGFRRCSFTAFFDHLSSFLSMMLLVFLKWLMNARAFWRSVTRVLLLCMMALFLHFLGPSLRFLTICQTFPASWLSSTFRFQISFFFSVIRSLTFSSASLYRDSSLCRFCFASSRCLIASSISVVIHIGVLLLTFLRPIFPIFPIRLRRMGESSTTDGATKREIHRQQNSRCSTLDKGWPGFFWETESLRLVTLGYCS